MTEYEQFVLEVEREQDREAKAILAYKKQMRDQRKPMTGTWVAVVGVLLLLGCGFWLFSAIDDYIKQAVRVLQP